MRRLWLIIIAIISAVSASAQETADDYMFYKLEQPPIEEFSISTDTLLFYRSVQHRRDMYGDMADYRFSFVGNARVVITLPSVDLVLMECRCGTLIILCCAV